MVSLNWNLFESKMKIPKLRVLSTKGRHLSNKLDSEACSEQDRQSVSQSGERTIALESSLVARKEMLTMIQHEITKCY